MKPKKILIIRFSSIGDIVLTTPVIRCVKEQLKAEVHFVSKSVFAPVLNANLYIDKIHSFTNEISELFDVLKKEEFDLVIDLHNNLRSLRLRKKLAVPSTVFSKINVRKFMAVNLKLTNMLPDKHIVERYLESVKHLGVKDDEKGLDYFLTKEDEVEVPKENYSVLVVGGSYFTKKIPMKKLEEICSMVNHPLLLVGGKEDVAEAKALSEKFGHVKNCCGQYTFGQSAFIIGASSQVITSDTGMMHIASAFNKKIVSLWGNTIPEFGMSPYLPNKKNVILEVNKLKCRPCSKLGFKKCPKGHFKCMLDIELKKSDLEL